MKNSFISILFCALCGLSVKAQTVTWDGGGLTNAFSDALNWSNDLVPGTTNAILFNGTSSKNCDFDVAVAVLSMSVNTGYGGVINGSNVAVSFAGSFSQTAGTFNATSDTIKFTAGSFFLSGGTFNHNSGTVTFSINAGTTATIGGTVVFNRLILRAGTGTTQRNIFFQTSTTTETLSAQMGTQGLAYLGTLAIHSLFDLRGTGNQNPLLNTANITLGGAGNFTLSSVQSATSRDRLPNLIFNTAGNISIVNAITVDGNWTYSSGTFLSGNSTINFYGNRSIIGTGNGFNNVAVQALGTLNFPSNSEVKVAGSLQIANTGNISFPTTSILGLNGNGSQSITHFATSSATITFGSVRVYTGAARTINLAASHANTRYVIVDSLKIDGGTTTFATNSRLILPSSATIKARIAQIGSASASITGSVTVQTIIPGGATGWANLGTPGIASQTVKNWDTHFSSGGANGIPMTCNGCSYDENAISGGPFTSIQGWNETTSAYTNLIGTTVLGSGTGYWVYVGDGPTATGNLTLLNFGTVIRGATNVAVTVSGGGFNLVSNPYPSPIRWSRVRANGSNSTLVQDAIYIYSADLGQTAFVSGVSDTPGGANDIIPTGQGFYVQANSAGNLAFAESNKVSATVVSNPLLRGSAQNNTTGDYFRLKVSGPYQDVNYTAFRTHPYASMDFDRSLDAHKIFHSPGYAYYPGPYTKYTTISTKDANNVDYAIQSIPVLTQSLSVPVLVRVMASGSFTIEATDFEDFATCIFLKDKLTNTLHNLKSGPYVVSINDTTSAPRFELLLCQQRGANPNSVSEIFEAENIWISQDQKGVFVKTKFEENTGARITVYNVVGQKIMDDILVEGKETSTHLDLDVQNQIVIVKVTTDKHTVTKKLVTH